MSAPSDNQTKSQPNHKYRFISKKGAGAFSDVIKAQAVKTGAYVAIKRMKATFKTIDQITSLREIQALRRLVDQPFIIRLLEILFDRNTGRLALVFELMEMNLYELIKNRKFHMPESEVKWMMWQILVAAKIAHNAGIFHRDEKLENILIDSLGNVVVSDFGSCRAINTPLPYTEYISTRWYRSPECILTDGFYGPEMDIFGLGCVMFELIALFPLFPGKDELDQIHRIHSVLGTPSRELLARIRNGTKNNPIKGDFPPQKGTGIAKLIPHASAHAVDLMMKMLEYDPRKRYTADDALRHPWFSDLESILTERIPNMPKNTVQKLGIKVNDATGTIDFGDKLYYCGCNTLQPEPARNLHGRTLEISPDARSRQMEKRPRKTPPNAKRILKNDALTDSAMASKPKYGLPQNVALTVRNNPPEDAALPRLPAIGGASSSSQKNKAALRTTLTLVSSSAQPMLNKYNHTKAAAQIRYPPGISVVAGANAPSNYRLYDGSKGDLLPALGKKSIPVNGPLHVKQQATRINYDRFYKSKY